MLYNIGVSIAFFLGILLIFKKNKSIADIILSVWLVVIGIHLFLFYLGINNTIFNYPYLLGVHFPIPLLHGPFLYLYAYTLTQNKKLKLYSFIHFFPALVSYVCLIDFFALGENQKLIVFANKGEGYEYYVVFNNLAILFSGVCYVLLTAIILYRYKKNIYNQFSNIEKINLNWLVLLLIGIALIWIFVIIGNDFYVFTLAVFFVVFVGFFGIRQTNIFITNFEVIIRENPIPGLISENSFTANTSINSSQHIQQNRNDNALKKKYLKSGLSTNDAVTLHLQLEQIMLTQKLFTQCDLTLVELAKCLQTHPNYLSQVINDIEGKNFYDYINNLRVNEFKRLANLPENKKLTIIALAFDSGFNSKSAFNKNFKKFTGIAPSEFVTKQNAHVQ